MIDIIHFYKVDSLENVRRFYGDLMGWTLYKDQSSCLIYDVEKIGKLGFCTHHPKKKNDATCISMIYKTKEEVDQMYLFFQENGFEVEKPIKNENFQIYHFFVRDYEQHLLEFQVFI